MLYLDDEIKLIFLTNRPGDERQRTQKLKQTFAERQRRQHSTNSDKSSEAVVFFALLVFLFFTFLNTESKDVDRVKDEKKSDEK